MRRRWLCDDRPRREVALHRAAGLDLIRVWGGGIAERPEFYAAADALGVLVMQEFWMTGDNNGRWAGEYSWPLDHAVYLDNARDTVRALRGHASLLFWCGGNELDPPGQVIRAQPQRLARCGVAAVGVSRVVRPRS